ncbi:MAG: O-antigen ligase domain-containing protein, partial [Acinetobacter sp.]
LNLGRLWGFGNTNPFEKSLFFAAVVFYLAKKSWNKSVVAGIFLITLSIFFFGVFSKYTGFAWSRLLMAYAALVSIIGFFVAKPSPKDCDYMLQSISRLAPYILIYGLILAVLFGLPMFQKDHTGASRLGGAAIPAFMAAASYASSIAAAYLFSVENKKRYLILSIFCIALCALSGTRMPTVVAATSVSIVLFFSFKGAVGRLGLVFLGGTFAVGFLLTAGEQLLLRFESSSKSGRELLWNAVIAWAERYPWHGVGFGHHAELIPERVSKLTGTFATHNEYIRLAAELGYLGAAIFIIGLFVVIFTAPRYLNKVQIISSLIVTLCFFVYAYSDNVFLLTYTLFGALAHVLGVQLISYRNAPSRSVEKSLFSSGHSHARVDK